MVYLRVFEIGHLGEHRVHATSCIRLMFVWGVDIWYSRWEAITFTHVYSGIISISRVDSSQVCVFDDWVSCCHIVCDVLVDISTRRHLYSDVSGSAGLFANYVFLFDIMLMLLVFVYVRMGKVIKSIHELLSVFSIWLTSGAGRAGHVLRLVGLYARVVIAA